MKQYLDLLETIQKNGKIAIDRTDIGTKSVFGLQFKHDLNHGFPLLTTKKMPFKAIVSELLWFISGSTDERRLAEILYNKPREELFDKRTIWTDNANADYWVKEGLKTSIGDLGKVYGYQWRSWGGCVDQLKNVINSINREPYSRRHIITTWNPLEINQCALPPCHVLIQFYVSEGKLSLQWYQRSADFFLGVPFNIASYALLTHMIAQVSGLGVGELIGTFGDCHIYVNHLDQVDEQLSRTPYLILPTLELNNEISNIDDFSIEDIKIKNYQSYDSIKAKMAV